MVEAWQSIRVFISSTFLDMNAERDHLVTDVFPELAERMASRHLHLRPIDLRWGVPKEDDSVKACLDIVEECRPYFVGLLGGRYGSIPPPPHLIESRVFEDILRGQGRNRRLAPRDAETLRNVYRQAELSDHVVLADGLSEVEQKEILAILERAGMWGAGQSITAMEITRGVLDSPPQPMISHFYFRSAAATKSVRRRDWSAYNEGDSAARCKLANLKALIRDRGLNPRRYRCRWDDQRRALVDLEEFGQMVLEDLWAEIDERFPPGLERADPPAAEREAAEYFVETRTANFVGRRGFLESLEAFVLDRMQEAPRNSGLLCVVGEPGSGKSSLLARLYREHKARHPDHAVVGHFVGASAASTDAHEMLVRICAELSALGDGAFDRPESFRELVDSFPELLAEVARVRPVVVVIDGLDQLEPAHDAREMRWLPEVLPPDVCFVLSTRAGDILAALQRRDEFSDVHLPLLSIAEARELVDGYLRQNLRKLEENEILALLSQASTDTPGEEEEVNPLYLLVALEELRAIGRFGILEEQIKAFPKELPGLFGTLLGRLERQHGKALVRDFLSLIAVGRGGQLEEDLRAMLRPEGKPKLPDLEWAKLFRSVRFYLLRRSEFVDFFHVQLREAVVERYLASEQALCAYHRRSAEHLADRGLDYPRTLTELPYHLDHAGSEEELFALVADPAFRRNKIELTGSVSSLTSDIDLALQCALASLDLANAARFGFMNADYSEGRFGKRDVLELSERDQAAAVRETRLFRPRARFRLLVLLALREVAAGRRAAADELIAEAGALRGAELGEGDAEFLRGAVLDLLRGGCPSAASLLATGLKSAAAGAQAARLVAEIDSKQQEIVLLAAVEWLRAAVRRAGVPGDTELRVFAELATAAAGMAEGHGRTRVVAALEGLTEDFASLITQTLELGDVLGFAMGAAIAISGDFFETGWWSTGIGARQAAEAHLGAALARSGDEEKGDALIDRAIDGCAQAVIDAGAVRQIVLALLTLPSPRWPELLGRLLATAVPEDAGGGRPVQALLHALAQGPAEPGLVGALDVVGSWLERLPTGSATNYRHLALAYARAGAAHRARRYESVAALPRWEVSFVGRNPFVSARAKLGILRGQLELAGLLGTQGPQWTRAWLRKMAGWVPGLETDKERVTALQDLADLAAVLQDEAGLEAVLHATGSVAEEELRAKLLVSLLDKVDGRSTEGTSFVRSAVLTAARRLSRERAKASVLASWMDDAGPQDRAEVEAVVQELGSIGDPSVRADLLARVAGVLSRWGDTTRAHDLWYRAALGDQEPAADAALFVARTAAAARSADGSWDEILAALPTKDPDVTQRLVEAIAAACDDDGRLERLERHVSRLRWPPYSSNADAVRFSIVRAWARMGNPDRGARLLLRWLRRTSSLSNSAFEEACETGRLLSRRWGGRAMLVRLIPHANTPARFRRLASGFAALSGVWAEEAYQQLQLAARENRFISRWQAVEALAAIATEMARNGSPAAASFLDSVGMPTKDTGEGELLQPVARAGALLERARALGQLYSGYGYSSWLAEADRALRATIEAVKEFRGVVFRAEAAQVAVEAWVEAARLGLAETGREAREAAESITAEASAKLDRSRGLAMLAHGHAELGEAAQALAVAEGIRADEENAKLLVSLVDDLAPVSLADAARCWQAIPTSDERKNGARAIARTMLRLGGAPPSSGFATPVQWRRASRLALLLGGLTLVVAAPGLCYWLLVDRFQWIVDALTGSNLPWSLLALAAIGGVLARLWAKALRNDVRRNPMRLAVSVLAIPLSPLGGGLYLFLKLLRMRPSARALLFTLARRIRERDGPAERLSYAALSAADQDLLDLVRTASREAEPFDVLFGALLTRASGHAAPALERLPALALPTEVPARLVELSRADRELRRASWPTRKIAETVSTAVTKCGFAATTAVLVPVDRILADRRRRRRRKGYALAQKAEATPWDFRGQVRLLRRAGRLLPDEMAVWHDFAIVLTGSGRLTEAIAAHQKAVANAAGDPREGETWHAFGYTLYQAERYAEGLEAFERALALLPPNSPLIEQAGIGRDLCRNMLPDP